MSARRDRTHVRDDIATQIKHLPPIRYTVYDFHIHVRRMIAVASNFAALHLVCVNWQPARLLSPIEVHVHKHLAVDIAHHPVLPLVLEPVSVLAVRVLALLHDAHPLGRRLEVGLGRRLRGDERR